jgi:hypothetical protein
MRNGKVYALPTQAHLITGSEFSSLPIRLFDTPDTMPDLPNSGSNRKNQIAGLGNQAKSFTYAQQEKLMPTPNTMDHLPARTPEQKALNKHKGGYANVRETVVNDLLPTPMARDSQAQGYEAGLRRATPQVGTIVKGLVDGDPRVLMPTPAARDYKDGQSEHERDGVVQTDTVARAIFNSGEVLLPTTRAQNGEDRNNKIWARDTSKPQNLENALAVTLLPTTTTNGNDRKGPNYSSAGILQELEIANGILPKEYKDWNHAKEKVKWAEPILGQTKTQLDSNTSWGKFEPAIRRWEQTLGRPAPLPTKPDGKDGAHRLSSKFTEWMMGLPEGWVTGVGLTRNEELKACGNGVVPQQAELALRVLLEGLTIPSTKNSKLFATPNTMDSLPPRYGEAYEKVKNAGGRKNRESSGNLREQVVHVLPGNPGEITMLPTPTVSDTYTDNLKSTQQKEGSMHSDTLPQAVRMVSDRIGVGQRREPLTYETDNQSIGRDKSTAEDRQ